MNSPLYRRTCIAMLLVFVANIGTGFNPAWVAHELGHGLEDPALVVPTVDGGHAHDDGDADPGNDGEHRAMHAAAQLVSAPSPIFLLHPAFRAGVIHSRLTNPPVAIATNGAPFRPPRA